MICFVCGFWRIMLVLLSFFFVISVYVLVLFHVKTCCQRHLLFCSLLCYTAPMRNCFVFCLVFPFAWPIRNWEILSMASFMCMCQQKVVYISRKKILYTLKVGERTINSRTGWYLSDLFLTRDSTFSGVEMKFLELQHEAQKRLSY